MMKKNKLSSILILLLLTILSSPVSAQEKHMKFMGIPMGIPIKKFHKALIKKDFVRTFTMDNADNYKGIFAGNSAGITVFNDVKTKKVHSIVVEIDCYSKEDALFKYNEFCKYIEEKYSKEEGIKEYLSFNELLKDKIDKGEVETFEWIKTYEANSNFGETKYFYIYNPIEGNPSNMLGRIFVTTTGDNSDYDNTSVHYVNVTYIDDSTHKESEEHKKEDF